MDFNEQLFDKIEDYLKGKLPQEEKAAFEKEIAKDSALAERVEMHRFEQEGIEYLVEKDLIQKLEEWETTPPAGIAKKNGNNPFWKYGLGFLFTLVIATAVILWIQKDKTEDVEPTKTEIPETPAEPVPTDPTPAINPVQDPPDPPTQKPREIAETNKSKPPSSIPKKDPIVPIENNYLALAETNYSSPENLKFGLKSSETDNTQNLLSVGLKAFGADQMDIAIKELNKIDKAKNPTEYEQAQEYLAHAYFRTGQFNKAAAIFRNMANDDKNGNTTIDRAEWYLLLSLLPEYKKHKSEADELVEKMINVDNYHNYAAAAATLKIELEKMMK